MPTSHSTYLTLLATRPGIAYVLRERRMAFPGGRPALVNVGDELLLYTTRSAYGNPNRGRGQVMGTAEVTSPVTSLEPPLQLAERSFASGCQLSISGLVPFGEGVVLSTLVNQLSVFQPNPHAWSARLRRSNLLLPAQDVALIRALLNPILRDPQETVDAYLERTERVRAGSR